MGFRSPRNVINSTKNIREDSGIIAASTNTSISIPITAADNPVLANSNEVATGAKVTSIYLSTFFIAEGGEVANEVPLVDWYIIKDPGNAWGTTFDANNLPTPGATGVHKNKRHILHTEKGLVGGGDASLAGLPMIFKGVVRIPRGRQRWGQSDVLRICARANFATKFCSQAIYK